MSNITWVPLDTTRLPGTPSEQYKKYGHRRRFRFVRPESRCCGLERHYSMLVGPPIRYPFANQSA